MQTRYITPDEFKEYFGIDLASELPEGDNPSDSVNSYLKRIEDRMEVFINSNFAKNINDMWTIFSDEQKRHYKLALLEQAIYIFRNGDISVDSGAEEDGVKIKRSDIRRLSIAPNAEQHLQMCGLWSRHIKSCNFLWGVYPWQ